MPKRETQPVAATQTPKANLPQTRALSCGSSSLPQPVSASFEFKVLCLGRISRPKALTSHTIYGNPNHWLEMLQKNAFHLSSTSLLRQPVSPLCQKYTLQHPHGFRMFKVK